MIIENLFPTAVSFFDLGRSFTDAEMSCVKNQPLKDNTGNKSSINTKLLNAPELTNIAEFVNKAVAEYVATVYLPANDIEVYIHGGGMFLLAEDKDIHVTFDNLKSVLTAEVYQHITAGNFQYVDVRFDKKVFVNEATISLVPTSTPEVSIEATSSLPE